MLLSTMELSAFATPMVLPGRQGVAAACVCPTARPRSIGSRSSPPPPPRMMAGRSSSGGDAFNFPGLGGDSGSGGSGGKGGFFDSPIVRAEGQALMRDQEALRELGRGYGHFDAAGQRIYIDQLEQLFDRWLVMVKRLELSPDFSAQLHRRQLIEHIADNGMTFDSFVAQTRRAFAMMRTQGPVSSFCC
ncbi:hypothetical protein MMPV_004212 [Pyropia vietnamensis]